MQTMQALVFYGPGDIRIEKRPIPEINSGEVLIKVKMAGVCGTDIRIFRGTKKIAAPRIIGHEFAGDIVALGAAVGDYKVGDRVTVYPTITCGECYACRAGRANICVNRITLGYELDGGFAEYVKIPATAVLNGNISKLPDAVSYELGAASEPLTAAYNGMTRTNLEKGQSILIVGAGPIGLCHVQLAKARGAGMILVAEPQAEKRALATLLGADYVIDPATEDIHARIKELTSGVGMDVVIVDVGLPKVIEESMEHLKKGGTYVIFAGSPVGSKISIDPNLIHYKELLVTGASAATPAYQREILKMIADGKFDLKTLITDIFPLEDWRKAFEMKGNYQGLKTLLRL